MFNSDSNLFRRASGLFEYPFLFTLYTDDCKLRLKIRDFLTGREYVSAMIIIVTDEACVAGLVLVVLSGSVVSWYTMTCQHTIFRQGFAFVCEFTQAVKLDL